MSDELPPLILAQPSRVIKSEDAFTSGTDLVTDMGQIFTMATGLSCPDNTCGYTTTTQVPDETDLASKIRLLKIHQDSVHTAEEMEPTAPAHNTDAAVVPTTVPHDDTTTNKDDDAKNLAYRELRTSPTTGDGRDYSFASCIEHEEYGDAAANIAYKEPRNSSTCRPSKFRKRNKSRRSDADANYTGMIGAVDETCYAGLF